MHSYFESHDRCPITELKASYLTYGLPQNDNVLVVEMQEYRKGIICSLIYNEMNSIKMVATLDKAQYALMRCYNRLGVMRNGRMKVSLTHVLTFLRMRKKNVYFVVWSRGNNCLRHGTFQNINTV